MAFYRFLLRFFYNTAIKFLKIILFSYYNMEENITLENNLLALLEERKITVKELKNLVDNVIDRYEQKFFPKIELGWYAFANGRFSADKNAYADLLGVVAWLNPDQNAIKGKRGLILLPKEINCFWQEKKVKTSICDEENGLENTKKLLSFSQNRKIIFPALEKCIQYRKDGYGEVFVPALNQLLLIGKNTEIVNNALKNIKGDLLRNWTFSATEFNQWRQCSVLFSSLCAGFCEKKLKNAVTRFVVAF